jgi:hypothetical protein
MLQCGRGIRQSAEGSKTVEDAAQSIIEYLYAECESPTTAAKSCALVRFYKTYQFRDLEPRLQLFARNQLRGAVASEQMKCLTLLATIGQEPRWRDRRQSEGHQAIPLPSTQMVEGAPMIAQLIREMGLDIAEVVSPQNSLLHERAGRTYNVFHVENAKGSPYIPAQEGFVDRYGVRSVLGFGGLLGDGEFFAVIMFSRGAITPETASRFRNIALDVKAVIHPFSVGPAPRDSRGRSASRP